MQLQVEVTIVGRQLFRDPPIPEVRWPEGWPLPRTGDLVTIPDAAPGAQLIMYCRSVDWYPGGKPDEDITEPFVTIVLGPRRPAGPMPLPVTGRLGGVE